MWHAPSTAFKGGGDTRFIQILSLRFRQTKRPNGLAVIETKGDHLNNPDDTKYKRDLLAFLSNNFAWDYSMPAGEMELVQDNGETVECALILMSNWNTELPAFLPPRLTSAELVSCTGKRSADPITNNPRFGNLTGMLKIPLGCCGLTQAKLPVLARLPLGHIDPQVAHPGRPGIRSCGCVKQHPKQRSRISASSPGVNRDPSASSVSSIRRIAAARSPAYMGTIRTGPSGFMPFSSANCWNRPPQPSPEPTSAPLTTSAYTSPPSASLAHSPARFQSWLSWVRKLSAVTSRLAETSVIRRNARLLRVSW